ELTMAPLFGLHMPNFTYPDLPPERLFDRVVETAQAAESAGFDLITVMDHFYQISVVGPETEPMLEAYSTLAALAQVTSRVRLAARHADMTHWFIATPEDFTRKNAVLEEHCSAVGRDPSTIVRTIGAPIWLCRDEREAEQAADRIPPARRAAMRPATPEQAAE